ncbi:hypothetical protein [Novosphingopyxis sp.]|uniref:hypothetical protein n=1 Tax=Novosphingopyxis sp. TaxID=2709690 RepID=UPI003B5AC77F
MQIGASEEIFEEQAAEGVAVPEQDPFESDEKWAEEPRPAHDSALLPAALVLLALAWTGFFLFAHRSELAALPAPERISEMLVSWSVPVLLIAMVWLLVLRTSHREARRFADVSLAMHKSGDALDLRIQSINNEISLAREFLSEQARELDMLGRTRARDIREAAEAIQVAFGESARQAEALDEVSRSAGGNLERLRNHLPVVTSTAKDVTNQIAAAGSGAQQQAEELTRRAAEVEEASARLGEAIDMLAQRSDETARSIDEHGAASEARLENFLAKASDTSGQLSHSLQAAVADMLASLDDSAERQRRLALESASTLRNQLEKLDNAMSDIGDRGGEQGERISRLAREIDESAEKARLRIEELDGTGSEATARIAFAVSAALENSEALAAGLDRNGGAVGALGERLAELRGLLGEIEQLSEDGLHPSVERLAGRIEQSIGLSERLASGIGKIDADSAEVHQRSAAFGEMLDRQRALIDELIAQSAPAFAERRENGVELERALMEARGALLRLAEDVEARLGASVAQVRDRSIEAADHARGALDGVVEQSAAKLRERTSEMLGAAVAEQMEGGASQWDALVSGALVRSDETTALLETRLAKLDQMTDNLEVRLERAHEQFEGVDDDAFARRMLLLTESLNSTSIDVAKLLSNEVTDTAWAAYLKGDRGVFTRRAVRLLDAGEVRVIAQHYEEDAEFRAQVNRYIHDFESIMRNLMSTRDGNAIGVTLLSSDVGKLYVALAQAIERLRT